jgi:hypothetical protein
MQWITREQAIPFDVPGVELTHDGPQAVRRDMRL